MRKAPCIDPIRFLGSRKSIGTGPCNDQIGSCVVAVPDICGVLAPMEWMQEQFWGWVWVYWVVTEKL